MTALGLLLAAIALLGPTVAAELRAGRCDGHHHCPMHGSATAAQADQQHHDLPGDPCSQEPSCGGGASLLGSPLSAALAVPAVIGLLLLTPAGRTRPPTATPLRPALLTAGLDHPPRRLP